MNDIKISGKYWDKDFIIRYSAKGKPFVKFSLFHPISRDGKQGFYFNVSVFNEQIIEALDTSLKRGDEVHIKGKLRISRYKSGDEWRNWTEIIAEECDIIKTRDDDDNDDDIIGDEVPF